MANTSLKRVGTWMLKKTTSLLAEVVIEGDSVVEGQVPAVTGNYLVATLPANAVIVRAYVQVLTASDAATSASAKLGTTEAGSEILSAANLKTLGKQGTFGTQADTGTGKDVFMTLTYTGAATTVGKYVVVVEYDEYTKNDGEYTEV
jgi:hypothetical protein